MYHMSSFDFVWWFQALALVGSLNHRIHWNKIQTIFFIAGTYSNKDKLRAIENSGGSLKKSTKKKLGFYKSSLKVFQPEFLLQIELSY